MEIGGRDHEVVRGAGVDNILHTVRIAVMAHAGASAMVFDFERLADWASDLTALLRGPVDAAAADLGVPLTVRFNGLDLDGVLSRPRGAAVAATPFEGVRKGVPAPFVGVDGFEFVREEAPELFLDVFGARDRSRNA